MSPGDLGLPEEFVLPAYDGRSIVNVPASVIQLFGGIPPAPPLARPILEKLSSNVRRVILVVADALGNRRLLDALEANPRNGFQTLLRRGGRITPLTSVFPSTTTAALTALWSGAAPAQHGFLGYELFLRDKAVLANMISFNPIATQKLGTEQLLAGGLDPNTFVPVPALPQYLQPAGVPVYNLIEQPYVNSALSRVQVRGVKETRGFVTSSDMWVALRAWLQELPAQPAVFFVYWSAIDTIAHTYGASSETVSAEVDNLAYSFQREFLRRLSPAAREGTLLLLTSDHGQIDTPAQQTVYLRGHPELREHLLFDCAGESRAAYLYCRNGHADAARAYLETRLGDRFAVVDSAAALDAGLFGPGPFAAETKHRIGDLIALARGPNVLWYGAEEPKLRGRHGSLTPEEMWVPLLAARLDA